MKNMKKLVSLLLAVVMVMAMATGVWAASSGTASAGAKGSISINNAIPKYDYTIYKLLDLESYYEVGNETEDEADDAYSYKVNENWADFFKEGATGRTYVDVDGNGYVTWKTGADAEKFAKEALAYAKEHSIAAIDTKKAPAATEGQTRSTVSFSDLDLGYYLVDSSVGALCSLNTTNAVAEITEKNNVPTSDKKVYEGETAGTSNTANIGDVVKFEATITAQPGAQSYVMHDTMDTGLTFKNEGDHVLAVTLNGNPVAADSYVLKTTPTDECTFEVEFTQTFCDTLDGDDTIVVTYYATVNANAEVGNGDGDAQTQDVNTNSMSLTYGDNNRTTTKVTETFTWEFSVLKYANEDPTNPLENAKFKLFKDAACTQAVKFKEVIAAGATTVYRVDPAGTVTEITTDETGKFEFEGLDAGDYYLKETDAPAGYNELKTTIQVRIAQDGTVSTVTMEDGKEKETPISDKVIGVNNNSGTLLPSTGGMGTTIFYVAGGVLVLLAVVILFARRRKNEEA